MKRHVKFIEEKFQEIYDQPTIEIDAVKIYLRPCISNPTIIECQLFLSV